MIARFGTVEINCVNNYLCVQSKESYIKKIWNYITDNTHTPWWNVNHLSPMRINAGIFPERIEIAEKFSIRYLNDIPEIDILACHQYYEKFMPLRSDVQKIQLLTLDPFFVERPWTRYLKGKKVLVIHPFEKSIKQQYEKRHLLFDNKDILPDFELITMKAVQTVAGNRSEFETWFDALAYMEQKISKIDFDVAILGCGAYGLPLAAFIKRLGKQAIHMGGATQLLFGIYGQRWVERFKGEKWEYRPGIVLDLDYNPIFNENWIYPLDEDTPKNAKIVEGACYWK